MEVVCTACDGAYELLVDYNVDTETWRCHRCRQDDRDPFALVPCNHCGTQVWTDHVPAFCLDCEWMLGEHSCTP